MPRLLWSGPARATIWLFGQAIFWSGAFLAYSIAWYWLVAIGALSYTLSRFALMPIVGPRIVGQTPSLLPSSVVEAASARPIQRATSELGGLPVYGMIHDGQADMAVLRVRLDQIPYTVGVKIEGVIESSTGTAHFHTDNLGDLFQSEFGVTLFPGTLNFLLDKDLDLPEPQRHQVAGRSWEFCPVVIAEYAVGVVIRGNKERLDYLEVVSPIKLRSKLTAQDGERFGMRILPGSFLATNIGGTA